AAPPPTALLRVHPPHVLAQRVQVVQASPAALPPTDKHRVPSSTRRALALRRDDYGVVYDPSARSRARRRRIRGGDVHTLLSLAVLAMLVRMMMLVVVMVEVVGGVLAYWVGAVAIAAALGRLDA